MRYYLVGELGQEIQAYLLKEVVDTGARWEYCCNNVLEIARRDGIWYTNRWTGLR